MGRGWGEGVGWRGRKGGRERGGEEGWEGERRKRGREGKGGGVFTGVSYVSEDALLFNAVA